MDLVIKEACYKGTRIIFGNDKQNYLKKCRQLLIEQGFTEIQIPIIQHFEIFAGKVGEENNNLMYNFKDRGGRSLCLSPEYTAVIQRLSNTYFNNQKDVKLFYVAECFRGEKPQNGRYRQFTQLGVEVLNPSIDYTEQLTDLSLSLTKDYTVILNTEAKRGLNYYRGYAFELEDIDSKLSVCGGGAYENGIGFAIGVDRLLFSAKKNKK